jgi:hypothetical protein
LNHGVSRFSLLFTLQLVTAPLDVTMHPAFSFAITFDHGMGGQRSPVGSRPGG